MLHDASRSEPHGDVPLLNCQDLVLGYPIPAGWRQVVDRVSFSIQRGETVALVGESGSGKSTIAKALVRLIPVKSGSCTFDGNELAGLPRPAYQQFRKRIQMIFQDPWQALNPRRTAGQLLMEPLLLHFPGLKGRSLDGRIDDLLDSVRLSPEIKYRYPSQLSGGQRQRVLLARALAVEPELLICDEPVSALDVTIQAQLLDLLQELKASRGLTLLFISHDLAVVQQLADRVLVLQKGKAVEWKSAVDLFRNPEHPYTRTLLEACPAW